MVKFVMYKCVLLYHQDGTVREFDNNFSLLAPFVCDALAEKEDRRYRRAVENDGRKALMSPSNVRRQPDAGPTVEESTGPRESVICLKYVHQDDNAHCDEN